MSEKKPKSETKKQEAKKPLKAAIVGYASSSKDKAPFGDPSWEIWGLNDLYIDIPRYDRWFQMHDDDILHSKDRRDPEHFKWLQKCQVPVYMQRQHPEIPNSVAFPLKEIVERFGLRYFTNSIAYMVALAIFEGAEEIGVFGVDMLQDSEYAGQRACCEAWLALASGMGIKVHVPKESALFKSNFWYGYQEKPAVGGVSEDWMHKEATRLNGEVRKLDNAIRDLQQKHAFCRGALHQMQYMLQHVANYNRGGQSLTGRSLPFPDESVKGRIENAMSVNIPEPAWNLLKAGGLEMAVEAGELSLAEAGNRVARAIAENQGQGQEVTS